MIDDFQEKFTSIALADVFPALSFIPTPFKSLMQNLVDNLNSVIGKEWNEHKDNFDKGKYRLPLQKYQIWHGVEQLLKPNILDQTK